jgi:hypothetical protein
MYVTQGDIVGTSIRLPMRGSGLGPGGYGSPWALPLPEPKNRFARRDTSEIATTDAGNTYDIAARYNWAAGSGAPLSWSYMLLDRYSVPRSKQWANIPIVGYQLSECISISYEDPCLRVNNTAPRVRANLFVGQKVCVK